MSALIGTLRDNMQVRREVEEDGGRWSKLDAISCHDVFAMLFNKYAWVGSALHLVNVTPPPSPHKLSFRQMAAFDLTITLPLNSIASSEATVDK